MKVNEFTVILNEQNNPELKCIHQYKWEIPLWEDVFDDIVWYESLVKELNNTFFLDIVAEEYAYIVALNNASEIVGIYQLSHGTCSETYSRNKELVTFLLLSGAEQFIHIHNHPGESDIIESEGDKGVRANIEVAAKIFNIQYKESIIIGKHTFGLSKRYYQSDKM